MWNASEGFFKNVNLKTLKTTKNQEMYLKVGTLGTSGSERDVVASY